MAQDIKIPEFKNLDKILYDKIVDEVIDTLAHQHDEEDIDDAIINGLEDA